MLELNIDRMARMHGAEHVQAFLITRGLSAREARTVAYPKKMRQLRDSLLQRLCEGLLCTPNDLFKWTGGKESHLTRLNKWMTPTLAGRLQGMRSPEELERAVTQVLEALEQEPKVVRMHGGRLFMNVRRLLELRGVKKFHRELRRMGFTASEASTLLGDTRRSFKLTLLGRLCEAFHCLPNDVFDFDGPDGHVLQAISKEEVPALDERLKGLTEEQLRRVFNSIKN